MTYKDSFEYSGCRYELVNIIKKENFGAEVKEGIQILELKSNTNEKKIVMSFLTNSVEFEAEDGYIGILCLDVDSITIENAGAMSWTDENTLTLITCITNELGYRLCIQVVEIKR